MPCCTVTTSRYSLPDWVGSSCCRALSEMPRLTHFSCRTSRVAFTRSSVLAVSRMDSPDQVADAPVSRKSKRVPTSLAVWLTALSISWRSTLLTMSNDGSATVKRLLPIFSIACAYGIGSSPGGSVASRARCLIPSLPGSARPGTAVAHVHGPGRVVKVPGNEGRGVAGLEHAPRVARAPTLFLTSCSLIRHPPVGHSQGCGSSTRCPDLRMITMPSA